MKVRSLLIAFAITFSGFASAQQIAAIAKKGNKVGFIDKSGNWLIEAKFDMVQAFKGDYALAKVNDKWGMIDKRGTWVIPAKFVRLSIPEDGYAMAMLGGLWVIVNDKGETVYKNTEYKKIAKLGNGMLVGYMKKTADYIDVSTGEKVATPIETKSLNQFSDGLARFKEKKWGYINKSGAYNIKPEFDDAKDFKDGKAMVKSAGKWGQIDLNGAWIIPAEFEKIQGFRNGQAIAKQNGKTGIIDEKGNWIKKIVFENEYVLAFEDIHPIKPVHVLIIPKGQYRSLVDFSSTASDQEIIAIVKSMGKIAKVMGLTKNGFSLMTNSGHNGGQTVSHLHFHLLGGEPVNWEKALREKNSINN